MCSSFSENSGRAFGRTGSAAAARQTRLIPVSGSIVEKNSPAESSYAA